MGSKRFPIWNRHRVYVGDNSFADNINDAFQKSRNEMITSSRIHVPLLQIPIVRSVDVKFSPHRCLLLFTDTKIRERSVGG